jgi:hypothetical protein
MLSPFELSPYHTDDGPLFTANFAMVAVVEHTIAENYERELASGIYFKSGRSEYVFRPNLK